MSVASSKHSSVDFEAMLAEGIGALGAEVTLAQQQDLIRYLGLLAKWNAVHNLTSVRDPRDMLIVHLLDSLSLLDLVDEWAPQTFVDVGSGAGLPAIPLAIARPAIEIHSIDAVNKKIGFQLQVKAELRLHRLHPLHTRVEAFRLPAPAQAIVSRAYTDLVKMLTSIDHLAGPSTVVIAMKGAVPTAEIAAVPANWTLREVRALEVPFLGAQRCAVVLKRSG